MDVMVGAAPDTERATRRFLARFVMCEVTAEIVARSVEVRRAMRLKLADAVIYATALETGRTLVTYNVRDYPEGTASVMVPR